VKARPADHVPCFFKLTRAYFTCTTAIITYSPKAACSALLKCQLFYVIFYCISGDNRRKVNFGFKIALKFSFLLQKSLDWIFFFFLTKDKHKVFNPR